MIEITVLRERNLHHNTEERRKAKEMCFQWITKRHNIKSGTVDGKSFLETFLVKFETDTHYNN